MDKCKHHGIIRVVYAISLGRIFFCPLTDFA
nr:MAG TPA: Holliday-junction resolvase-like of SPT6 [Caudoviricetes sp.]DAS16491.1 MAG TPA: Holliday-junction resolvase-like of SPT6 [Caudoviricetes sp.]